MDCVGHRLGYVSVGNMCFNWVHSMQSRDRCGFRSGTYPPWKYLCRAHSYFLGVRPVKRRPFPPFRCRTGAERRTLISANSTFGRRCKMEWTCRTDNVAPKKKGKAENEPEADVLVQFSDVRLDSSPPH